MAAEVGFADAAMNPSGISSKASKPRRSPALRSGEHDPGRHPLFPCPESGNLLLPCLLSFPGVFKRRRAGADPLTPQPSWAVLMKTRALASIWLVQWHAVLTINKRLPTSTLRGHEPK